MVSKDALCGYSMMGVDELHTGGRRFLEGVKAFAKVPAVVAAFGDEVHFLPFVLAHISGPELAGATIKTHAPGIAQSVGPDFTARGHAAIGEGIAGGNRVRKTSGAAVHIDADDFAEK